MEKHRIDEWRRLAGKTQDDIARILEISNSGYRLKESGKNDWKIHEIKKLMKLFHIKFDQIEF